MSFEDVALSRLRGQREEADRALSLVRETEEAARGFAERLFAGLEYTAELGRKAGFDITAESERGIFTMHAEAAPGSEAEVAFALVRGAAAETDEDLMHEELSRYSLDPSGYSGRILGWSEQIGEEACQTFAVYRDGLWKTKGIFVARARGRADDPDEVLNGFCLRITGRLIDLAALTGGVGRRWAEDSYTLLDHRQRSKRPPTALRLPRHVERAQR